MVTLHQLRCFLATLEHGSFTAAAAALGYAQPSISEQVRLLEQHVGAALFHRVGRGLVPTEAARAMAGHAAQALAAVDEAGRAVTAVRRLLTGTVRFGLFGSSRFYLGAELVIDVISSHPGVRVELAGQHSADVLAQLRKGTLEAALVSLPVDDEALAVNPVMRDELVYISAHPQRLGKAVTPADLAAVPLVLPHVSWREMDSTRRQLARGMQSAGYPLRPQIEVEDTETALDIAATGLADTISWRAVLHRLGDRLPAGIGWVPLRPRLYETFAIVHRPGAHLSAASRVVIELASSRMRALDRELRRIPDRSPGGRPGES